MFNAKCDIPFSLKKKKVKLMSNIFVTPHKYVFLVAYINNVHVLNNNLH